MARATEINLSSPSQRHDYREIIFRIKSISLWLKNASLADQGSENFSVKVIFAR